MRILFRLKRNTFITWGAGVITDVIEPNAPIQFISTVSNYFLLILVQSKTVSELGLDHVSALSSLTLAFACASSDTR